MRWRGGGHLTNAKNGNGLPYKPLTVEHRPTVLTLRLGCTKLPAGTPRTARIAFGGDASALPSSARRG
jgi:hypothetical protein